MIHAIESIQRSVVVPVPRERAFEVFTSEMTGWWPSDHHIGSAPIEQIVIEPARGRALVHAPHRRQRDIDGIRSRLGAA